MAPRIAAVDEAEHRGDAQEAMRLIHEQMLGPDGQAFWRPARINRLSQVVLLGPTCRAGRSRAGSSRRRTTRSGPPGDRLTLRCLDLAIEVRGGTEGLSQYGEEDARCKVVDHDWVFRQLYLYELGGLARFVRSRATPDLVAGADRIHDWIRAPMAALRLVDRASDTVTWERLDTGEEVEVANIGSAAVVIPGEHVLGRLVPIESGWMLEGAPLVVPRAAAERVAADPPSWLDAVRDWRPEIQTGGFDDGLAHDVRDLVWQLVLREPGDPVPGPEEVGTHLATRTLALVRECLEEEHEVAPDDVDTWACLRAALLSLSVVFRLPSVAEPEDAERLECLSELLAPPVDVICRWLADEIREGGMSEIALEFCTWKRSRWPRCGRSCPRSWRPP